MSDTAKLVEKATAWLSQIEFLNYSFNVRESHGGVFLQAAYVDSDIYTGKSEIQRTRKWLLSPAMTESEVISTAFKCCLTSMEHRTREAFKFNGSRIFGPHFNVNDLWRLCQDREDAGGREQMQPARAGT